MELTAINAHEVIKSKLMFLVDDYGFTITRDEEKNYAYLIDFQKDAIVLSFNYDFRDNFFYFDYTNEIISTSLVTLFELYNESFNQDDFLHDIISNDIILKNYVTHLKLSIHQLLSHS